MPAKQSDSGAHDDTSQHILHALDGDRRSVAWLVERFDPCLYAAARVHLGSRLRAFLEPEDLVLEVWAVALVKLGGLAFDGASSTRGFLAFLTTTMRHVVNNLLRKHLRAAESGRPEPATRATHLDDVPADLTAVTARVRHQELRDRFATALDTLGEDERRLVVLRGFEGVPYREVALLLAAEPGTLAVRYHRALERLRSILPESILDELDGD